MRYALIENNQVKDIFIEPEGFSIEDCFPVAVASLYIECPNNIIEGDFYNPDTLEFSENPDKKFPNYPDWFNSLIIKQNELDDYSTKLTPLIDSLPMNFARLSEYKNSLSLVLSGVEEMVEIDGQQFSGDKFKLMIDALKKFEEDKSVVMKVHVQNINSSNNKVDIEAYDFTTGWPETNILIQTT